jgi:Zn-dependent metalloprotease
VILAVVLLAALLVARTCGATETEISKEQAIVIARDAVDYTPTREMVRLLKRGLNSQEHWAVSLSVEQADGTLENVTVVVVDANTGEIVEIRKEG